MSKINTSQYDYEKDIEEEEDPNEEDKNPNEEEEDEKPNEEEEEEEEEDENPNEEDENPNEEEEEEEEEDYENEEDIMDDETRQIIYKTLNKNINRGESLFDNKKVIHNNYNNCDKVNKTKKTFSLNEFIEKINIEEDKNKPKKFISSRASEKRKHLGINKETNPKRCFNARLPPFNFVHGQKEVHQFVNFNNKEDFPSLS